MNEVHTVRLIFHPLFMTLQNEITPVTRMLIKPKRAVNLPSMGFFLGSGGGSSGAGGSSAPESVSAGSAGSASAPNYLRSIILINIKFMLILIVGHL